AGLDAAPRRCAVRPEPLALSRFCSCGRREDVNERSHHQYKEADRAQPAPLQHGVILADDGNVVTLRRRVVPNIGWQLVLERYIASRNSFTAGYGRRAIVRSTIKPCSLSTMTSKLSILWPSMVPTQRETVVCSSSLNSVV